MDQQEENYVNNLQNQLNQANSEKIEYAKAANAASSTFQSTQDANLIEFQLEMDSILERMDHSLRGHILKWDEKGNLLWQEPKDTRNIIFSDLGTQILLRFLSQYLNRNTILSNYEQIVIYHRLNDIGNELVDLIQNRYEDMFYSTGFDGFKKQLGYEDDEEVSEEDEKKIEQMIIDERKEKIKHYPITVLPIVHAIESAYNRAIGGEERSSLRKQMMVTQSEGTTQTNFPAPQKKGFSIFHPIKSLRA